MIDSSLVATYVDDKTLTCVSPAAQAQCAFANLEVYPPPLPLSNPFHSLCPLPNLEVYPPLPHLEV